MNLADSELWRETRVLYFLSVHLYWNIPRSMIIICWHPGRTSTAQRAALIRINSINYSQWQVVADTEYVSGDI